MKIPELLTWTFWDALRPRKILLISVLSSVGPLFALILLLGVENKTRSQADYSLVVQMAVYSFTMVLLSIAYGCSAVSAEVTGRTIPYIVTRPISRMSVLLAKYITAVVVVSFASIASCLMTAAVLSIGRIGADRVLNDLWVLPIGAVTYSAICVALSALLVRPVLPAVFYVFAFESWVWAVPGDFPKLSLMTYLRVLADHSPSDTGVPRGMMELLAQLSPTTITRDQSWTTLAIVVVISLTAAMVAFSRGEYVPKEEAA